MGRLGGIVVFLVLSATGCALREVPPATPIEPEAASVERQHLKDVETLLRFGEVLAGASPDERQRECREFAQAHQSGRKIGRQLHLFLAQLLVSDCGDIAMTVETIRAKRSAIGDDRTWRLFTYLEQVLRRLDDETRQRKDLEQKLTRVWRKVHATQQQLKGEEIKIKSLQEKLDALKSIEQDMGPSPGEH